MPAQPKEPDDADRTPPGELASPVQASAALGPPAAALGPPEAGRRRASQASKKKTYTRRGVLGGAVVGGGAVAAARLLILEKPDVLARLGGDFGASADPKGHLHNWNIVDQRAAAQAQATRAQAVAGPPAIPEPLLVAQLLRRVTFGFSDAQYQQALSMGFRRTVEQFLSTPPAQPPPFPGEDQVQTSIKLDALQEWWIRHMLTTPTPFAERLTLFMASIFTSDTNKVGLDSPFLIWQNRTWRSLVLSDLRTILRSVSIDPAMLVYLDGNRSNGRPPSVPNQNYARELMELFSIGLSYTEADVQNGARALSGWRVPTAQDNSRVGIFDANRHFTGAVTFLGRTGPMGLDQVIDAILAHPACAPFIAGKFVQEFVTPNPDQGFVNRLAAGFRNSGYQLKTLLRDMLLSPEFAAQANYRALVKSPLDYMVGAARLLGADLTTTIRGYAAAMGHQPFDPPDVGGYPRNVAWLSPIGLMDRVNFVTDTLGMIKTLPASSLVVSRYLDGVLSAGTGQALGQAPSEARKWWVALASPDAQLA